MERARREVYQWHEEFVQQFHRDDYSFMEHVYLKYDHTQRVLIEVRGIAEALQITPQLQVVVEIAALLHDLGRYGVPASPYQSAFQDTYLLATIEILEREKPLRYFPDEIQTSIMTVLRSLPLKNVPSTLSSEDRLALQIVKDAYRIDVWRLLSDYYSTPVEERGGAMMITLPEGETVKESLLARFSEGVEIPLAEVENSTELKLYQISWAYSINLAYTAQLVSRRRYVGRIVDSLPPQTALRIPAGQAIRYIEQMAEEAEIQGLKGR